MRLPIFQGFDAQTFSMFQTRWSSILNPFLTTTSPVTSINGLTGAIKIAGGTDISVTDPPAVITISYTGSSSSGVTSLNSLTGVLTLAGTNGISLSTVGSTIDISGAAFVTSVTASAPLSSSGGTTPNISFTGTYVSSLNSLSGALSLLGTSGITITPSGSNITIDQSANIDGGSANSNYVVSQMIDGGHA